MKSFTLAGVCNSTSGFGQQFCMLVRWLDQQGLAFKVRPIGPKPFNCSEAPLPGALEKHLDADGGNEWTIQHSPPSYGIQSSTLKTALYTVWESDTLPTKHAETLNRADLILTASEFNASAFRRAGVTQPIRVFPHGVEDFWFAPKLPVSGPFTFLAGGEANGVSPARKGLDDVIQAFLCAFPQEQDVRLLVHQTPMSVWGPKRRDPRITVRRRFLKSTELLAWMHRGNVFVSASRCEGFGLFPLQAMATGIPAIGCHYGGQLEYLDRANSYPVLFDLQPVTQALPEYEGRWAVPQIESLAAQMRAVMEDPGYSARATAARATAERFTVEQAGQKLLVILKEFGIVD